MCYLCSLQAQEIARLQAVVADLQAQLQQSRQKANVHVQHNNTSHGQSTQHAAGTSLAASWDSAVTLAKQQVQHAGVLQAAQAAVAEQPCHPAASQSGSPAGNSHPPAALANGLHHSLSLLVGAHADSLSPALLSGAKSTTTPPQDAINGLLQAALDAGQHEQQHNDLMQQVLQPMHELHAQQHLHSLQQQPQDTFSDSDTPIMQLNSHSYSPVLHDQQQLQESDTVVVSRREYELLLLKEAAMDAVREGITIADCSQPDMPLIYINKGFCKMTGYSRDEVLGKNCRFLQVGMTLLMY